MLKQASRRKYHYIYRTTCIVTGRYYLGMHSTDNLNDGYIGSGKRLWYSVNKHGAENHVCEIQEHYFTREWLREREAELVCAETLTDPMCMNLKVGGEGGWDAINANSELVSRRNRKRASHRVVSDEQLEKARRAAVTPEAQAKRIKSRIEKNGNYNSSNIGSSRTEETKKNMSAAHSGEKNSQHGSCWINDGISVIKVPKEELSFRLEQGWKRGRKFME